jgi:hypothetical protein
VHMGVAKGTVWCGANIHYMGVASTRCGMEPISTYVALALTTTATAVTSTSIQNMIIE